MITEGNAAISLRRLGAPSVINNNQNKDQLYIVKKEHLSLYYRNLLFQNVMDPIDKIWFCAYVSTMYAFLNNFVKFGFPDSALDWKIRQSWNPDDFFFCFFFQIYFLVGLFSIANALYIE